MVTVGLLPRPLAENLVTVQTPRASPASASLSLSCSTPSTCSATLPAPRMESTRSRGGGSQSSPTAVWQCLLPLASSPRSRSSAQPHPDSSPTSTVRQYCFPQTRACPFLLAFLKDCVQAASWSHCGTTAWGSFATQHLPSAFV